MWNYHFHFSINNNMHRSFSLKTHHILLQMQLLSEVGAMKWNMIFTFCLNQTNTFQCEHIPVRTHSSANTFQCEHIPVRTHSSANTFQCAHIPVRTHSSANTFQCEHIPVRTHWWGNCRWEQNFTKHPKGQTGCEITFAGLRSNFTFSSKWRNIIRIHRKWDYVFIAIWHRNYFSHYSLTLQTLTQWNMILSCFLAGI